MGCCSNDSHEEENDSCCCGGSGEGHHGHHDEEGCGCMGNGRQFITKAEKIEKLKQYQDMLEKELTGVKEAISELEK